MELYPEKGLKIVNNFNVYTDEKVEETLEWRDYKYWVLQETEKDKVNFSEDQPFYEKVRIGNYVDYLVAEWVGKHPEK